MLASSASLTEKTLQETYGRNCQILGARAPEVLQTLLPFQKSYSLILKEGRIDADFGAGGIYGGDALKFSLLQVQAFEERPTRLFPDFENIELSVDKSLLAHRYAAELHKRLTGSFRLPPLSESRHMPLLVLVGLGFGFHLRALLERYEVQNLIILDVPAFFSLSLHTLDWEMLLNYYSKPGRSLHLIVHDKLLLEQNMDIAFADVLRTAQQINPGLFYWGYYFEHLQYTPPLRFVEWLSRSPAFAELFHGYFDDELWSLRWTLEKIRKKIPLYFPQKKVPPGSVAFVLGAGPSLDPAIEKIREYQDRAVIFSCGSTISALKRAGIVPDFHVEIERTKYTYDVLTEVGRDFLKKTRLIANNPLWTDCFKLFKKGYMFLKLNDTGALLLEQAGSPIIWHTGPTVTAAGVALAAEFGFEEIYLFGVDLGSKDPQKHHSGLTNYYDPQSMLSQVAVELSMPAPGNFGGTVYTNQWFAITKHSIEQTIKKKGVKVYNASDGILIEWAIPTPLENLRLEKTSHKQQAIKAIEENFDTRYPKTLKPAEHLKRLVADFENLSERVRDYAKKFDFRKRQEVVQSFTQLTKDLLGLKNPLLYNLLYHNTHQWSQVVLGQALSMGEEEREEFIRFFWELYRAFLKEAMGQVKELAEELR